jgi:hypothetical protein
MPLSDILLYGRWQSQRAAQAYIRKGEVAVLRSKQIISGSDWKRLTNWSVLAPQAWLIFDSYFKVHEEPQKLQAVTMKRLLALEGVTS